MQNILKILTNFRKWLKKQIPYLIVIGLLITLIFVFFWTRVIIIVKSGEAGVLYRLFFDGTVTDYPYPEGLHFNWPWDTMFIYNVRIQTILHEFNVLTQEGLPIHLKLAIRFRPEYEMVGVLHQQVGPDYVNTIIIPQVESVLRKNIGQLTPEDVYTNKEGILTNIIIRALEEAGQKFVIIDDVIIRNVDLPDQVRQAIEEKLIQNQLYLAYEYKLQREEQEAERKRIEAAGIKDYQEILNKSLNPQILKWHGVEATLKLATSENSKVVVIGSGEDGLPLILGPMYK
jgi:regulator of protease activity HflC (stomatin/prohibitin superfamily)